MTFKNKQSGFTLIELLVVIAIIGILASIVLASLNSARSKGNDAKIEGQLSNLRAAMELVYTQNNDYGTYNSGTAKACPISTDTGTANNSIGFLDTTSNAYGLLVGTSSTSGVSTTSCFSNGTSWAAAANLATSTTASPTYWCVDSTGKSAKESGTALTATTLGTTLCP